MKQRESGLPFDDIRQLVRELPEADQNAVELTRGQVISGERLSEFAVWYAAWSGRSPQIHRPLLAIFAGTHGLETALYGENHAAPLYAAATEMAEGSNWLNRLCSQVGLGLKFFDLALQLPVTDIRDDAALDEKMCAGTIGFGMESIAGGTDLLCLSTVEGTVPHSSMALLNALDLPASALGGQRADLIKELSQQQRSRKEDPLEALRRLGGRETAALVGAVLAARTQHIPVVVSGWTALAALAVMWSMEPAAISNCVLAQAQDEAMFDVAKKLSLPVLHSTPVSDNSAVAAVLAAMVVRAAGSMAG